MQMFLRLPREADMNVMVYYPALSVFSQREPVVLLGCFII
jgi:hypothetical protein